MGMRSPEGNRRCLWGSGQCLDKGTGLPQGEQGLEEEGGRGKRQGGNSPLGNLGEQFPEVGCADWGGEGSKRTLQEPGAARVLNHPPPSAPSSYGVNRSLGFAPGMLPSW